jgi:DNA-binding MarR family transcriptional regulator
MTARPDLRRIAEELLILALEEDGRTADVDLVRLERDSDDLVLMAQSLLRLRRLRSRHFDDDLFREPAWDLLLDLFVQKARGRRVSITSACQAAYVPEATALRFIAWLKARGLIERTKDEGDRRRSFLTLSARGLAAMTGYLHDASSDLGNVKRRARLLFEARP